MKTAIEILSTAGTFCLFFAMAYITTSMDVVAIMFWAFVVAGIAGLAVTLKIEETDNAEDE